jgi:hypothetical protein
VTDDRDDIQPDTPEAAAEEAKRPDPRMRPADPAGTQPKWDPDELLPKEKPPAAHGRLWSRQGESDADVEDREVVGAPAAAATAADGAGVASPPPSRYSARFHFLLGALLAIGAAGVALLVAALVGGSSNTKTITLGTGPAWSDWRPTATTGTEAAQQIADHVGQEYKLPNGQQLVMVTGDALEIANLPVTVAIQEPVSQGGSIDFSDGSGVLYRLCGTGTRTCKIGYGRPSLQRADLLRRESLELALYSFRYLGVEQAVVFQPPSVHQSTNPRTHKVTTTAARPTALLFRRTMTGIPAAIQHPLDSTLSSRTPTISGMTRSPDAATVAALTSANQYNFAFQESNQDARAFLVLNSPTG